MKSFFIALGLVFVAITLNTIITPKAPEISQKQIPKKVSVYTIGKAPRITLSAKAQKAGVVKISSQTPGIVSVINVTNGQSVSKGDILLTLANNYSGDNASAVSEQLAQTSYQNTKDTYDTQKDIIQKQRMLADQQKDNNDALTAITKTSVDETQSLVNLNSDILNRIKANISDLQISNVGGANDAAIQNAQQLQAQLQGGNNQLQSAARNAAYASNPTNPPTLIANISHDMAIEQLSIQEKALNMSLESGRLQLELAQIAASMMEPAAPFDGVVSEVHVAQGQSVTPGTLLVTISGQDKTATILAKVPMDTANNISKLEESTLYIGKHVYQTLPEYVSAEATDGTLNTVIFSLPEEEYGNVADGQYIRVDVPIGYPNSTQTTPYVPIDSVYQTQDGAFIYVAVNNKVQSRKVTLGNVLGSSVEIENGLHNGDRVILDRTVVVGDNIEISNQSYGTK